MNEMNQDRASNRFRRQLCPVLALMVIWMGVLAVAIPSGCARRKDGSREQPPSSSKGTLREERGSSHATSDDVSRPASESAPGGETSNPDRAADRTEARASETGGEGSDAIADLESAPDQPAPAHEANWTPNRAPGIFSSNGGRAWSPENPFGLLGGPWHDAESYRTWLRGEYDRAAALYRPLGNQVRIIHHMPAGWNTEDLDGDGVGDFGMSGALVTRATMNGKLPDGRELYPWRWDIFAEELVHFKAQYPGATVGVYMSGDVPAGWMAKKAPTLYESIGFANGHDHAPELAALGIPHVPFIPHTRSKSEVQLRRYIDDTLRLPRDYAGLIAVASDAFRKGPWTDEARDAWVRTVRTVKAHLPQARVGTFGPPTVRIELGERTSSRRSVEWWGWLWNEVDVVFPQVYWTSQGEDQGDLQDELARTHGQLDAALKVGKPVYAFINGTTRRDDRVMLRTDYLTAKVAMMLEEYGEALAGVVYWSATTRPADTTNRFTGHLSALAALFDGEKSMHHSVAWPAEDYDHENERHRRVVLEDVIPPLVEMGIDEFWFDATSQAEALDDAVKLIEAIRERFPGVDGGIEAYPVDEVHQLRGDVLARVPALATHCINVTAPGSTVWQLPLAEQAALFVVLKDQDNVAAPTLQDALAYAARGQIVLSDNPKYDAWVVIAFRPAPNSSDD